MEYNIIWFKTIEDIATLVKTLNLTPDEENELWEKLIALLHSQVNPLEPYDEEKKEEQNGLFYTIINNIDFPDGENGRSELYELIKKLEDTKDYWNDSLFRLINFFSKRVSNYDDDYVVLKSDSPNQKGDITIGMLKKANAGNNFTDDNTLKQNVEECVYPWYNSSQKEMSYLDVRKKDALIKDIELVQKNQFTEPEKNNIKYWIRLLMPQYGRRVLIEDLDRNFWVITWTISAISNYIFNTESPINKMFNGLLREISELWENVIYLWTETAALSAKKEKNIRIIVLPIQTKKNEHWRQYDYIDTDIQEDWYSYTINDDGQISFKKGIGTFHKNMEERIQYLTSIYNNQDLFVIPYVRINNYKHNYYAAEWYPGAYYYTNKSQKWKAYDLYETGNKQLIISLTHNKDRFSPYVYASKIDNGKILYSYPFDTVNEVNTNLIKLNMYGALRTITNVSFSEEKDVTTSSISLNIYDAAAEGILNNSRLLGTFTKTEINDNDIYFIFSYAPEAKKIPNNIEKNTLYSKNINSTTSGYYLGELASWRKQTKIN